MLFRSVIIHDDGIKIISIKSNFEFKFKQLEDIKTELKESFKYNKFPLAVNGTKISKNKEELGLGIILKRITKKSHHAASYLGPFLEEIGVLENHKEIEKSKNTLTYWKVNKINDSITIKQLIEEYYSDN